MVDFEVCDQTTAPDAIIAVLRTLTHKDQTKGSTRGTFKLKRHTHPNPRQIEGWQEFCLPSMFVEGLVLEVDIPGASDGLERWIIPETFAERMFIEFIESYQMVPFQEIFDCIIVAAEDDESKYILCTSTLEDLGAFDPAGMEYTHGFDECIEDTDGVEPTAERRGLAITLDGS